MAVSDFLLPAHVSFINYITCKSFAILSDNCQIDLKVNIYLFVTVYCFIYCQIAWGVYLCLCIRQICFKLDHVPPSDFQWHSQRKYWNFFVLFIVTSAITFLSALVSGSFAMAQMSHRSSISSNVNRFTWIKVIVLNLSLQCF